MMIMMAREWNEWSERSHWDCDRQKKSERRIVQLIESTPHFRVPIQSGTQQKKSTLLKRTEKKSISFMITRLTVSPFGICRTRSNVRIAVMPFCVESQVAFANSTLNAHTHSLPAKRWRTKSNYLMDDKQEVLSSSAARARPTYGFVAGAVCVSAGIRRHCNSTFMLSCECNAISPKEPSKRMKNNHTTHSAITKDIDKISYGE